VDNSEQTSLELSQACFQIILGTNHGLRRGCASASGGEVVERRRNRLDQRCEIIWSD